jgi:hypothetical protein
MTQAIFRTRCGRRVLIMLLLPSTSCIGQTLSSPASAVSSLSQLPLPFRGIAAALGDRFLTPGKERATFVGTRTESGKTSPCTLTYELPNKFRIDDTGLQAATLLFDGATLSGSNRALAEADQDRVESLLDDVPDTLLFSRIHGALPRCRWPENRLRLWRKQ